MIKQVAIWLQYLKYGIGCGSRKQPLLNLWYRDYAMLGGAVAVAMYDDHLLANVFYRAGIIERWKMGTLNIIDWCSENDAK